MVVTIRCGTYYVEKFPSRSLKKGAGRSSGAIGVEDLLRYTLLRGGPSEYYDALVVSTVTPRPREHMIGCLAHTAYDS